MRYSQGERSIAITRYTLTVGRRDRRSQGSSTGRQITDSINCVTSDHMTESAGKYFRQRMRVLASSRVQAGSYVNKEGQRVYITEVILDNQESVDNKGASSGGNQSQDRPVSNSPLGDGLMSIPDRVENDGFPLN